ncbi:DUF6531 domain-containing protein [Pseudomonas sp. GD03944]|uniref:DUF6531 domain-containing protein n=1 Tax=Pseudomonas sp. GD03944 TaxID=2975409 RepID=UPI00244CAAF6|nr:DUF6531 domain-containing protein [Pseudomonas sp. GD03944]MDH1265678.1 DUF6531 domain-containing protein [Pseudomonas sp. GD03944]
MESTSMRLARIAAVTSLLILAQAAYGSCTLRFTSPANGATVNTPSITVFGQGGADASQGDAGTVTATLNGAAFFNYSGSFTAAVTFLQSRGAPVTLRPGLNFLSVTGSVGGCSANDSMTVMYSPDITLNKNKGNPGDNLTCDAPGKAQGNPINIAIGNKYQEESDYTGMGIYPIRFSRSYNSVDGYWRHNYSARLRISANTLTLVKRDGNESRFTVSGSTITSELSELGKISQDGTNWIYLSPAQERFKFDNLGRLISTTSPQGQTHALSYSSSTVTVVDDFGHTLTLTQDDRGQPLTMNTAGTSVTYNYDNVSRLISLTKVQSSATQNRTFHYENTSYPRFLTGITDESGVRYATWAYDSQGRAISSEHAGAVEKITLTYNSDGSTTITNELGKKTTYRFQNIQGVRHVVAIEGQPSANCPSSNSAFTYDTRGLLKSKTDNKGYVTTYDYNTRGLESSRTEASGTPQARTITTTWHSDFFAPIAVVEPHQTTNYTYDPQGRQISQTVTPH